MTKLYIRLWLAVVLAVGLLTIVFVALTRFHVEQRLADQAALNNAREVAPRELRLRDEAGNVVALGQSRSTRIPGQGVEYAVTLNDGRTWQLLIGPRLGPDGTPMARRDAASAPLMPPPHLMGGLGGFGGFAWPRRPLGLVFVLAFVGLAVAIGAYPVMRRLTQRLDALKVGVEAFGRGALGTRVAVVGQDEIAFLAQQFNDSAARIETLVNVHKKLLANASHELRSPLARIRMGLELMQSAPSEQLQIEIRRSLEELDQLIGEILLASRLDSRDADAGALESVDCLGLLAEECARLNVPLLPSAASQGDAQILGVDKLVRRLVRNLLENAQRYGGEAIEAHFESHAGGVRIQVWDGGPGVPATERERIFEPFYRLPGASEASGGVGLGLALVRSIALRHGGTVACIDRPDGARGACFSVQLPKTAA